MTTDELMAAAEAEIDHQLRDLPFAPGTKEAFRKWLTVAWCAGYVYCAERQLGQLKVLQEAFR